VNALACAHLSRFVELAFKFSTGLKVFQILATALLIICFPVQMWLLTGRIYAHSNDAT
jgi:uncharacterized protein YhhL (DUF1145 family)